MISKPAGLDYEDFADTFLWIKNESGRIIPFIRNPIQKLLYKKMQYERARGNRYFMILKYRRGGITTEQQAINFYTALQRGQAVVTLAHENNDTEKIFDIAKLFYSSLHPAYKPKRSRKIKRELEFPNLHSKYYIGTAGAAAFGRGSTLQRFHASEVAFWPGSDDDIDNLIASLALASRKGEGVLETTANGTNNWFYNKWQEVSEGQRLWCPIFIGWYEDLRNQLPIVDREEREYILSSYTQEEEHLVKSYNLAPEQIKWRRIQKDSLRRLFPQEYPETAEEAFLVSGTSYFDLVTIEKMEQLVKEPNSQKWGGHYKVWKSPIPGRRYVAGTDVASGANPDDPKLDWSVTQVLDAKTGEHVATLKMKAKPTEFTKRSIMVLEEYNKAFWGIERNEYGHAVLNQALNVHKYKNLYLHKKYDKASKQKIMQQRLSTKKETRPIMIYDLANAMETGELKTYSSSFIRECRNFVLKKGRMEAATGFHDDEVFSMAIANQMRKHKKKTPGVVSW